MLHTCMRAGFGWYRGGVGDGTPINTADLQKAQSSNIKCPAGSFKVCVCRQSMSWQAAADLFGSQYFKSSGLQSRTPSRHHTTQGCQRLMFVCACMQAGWNLDPCKSCGKGVLSDPTSTDGLGLSSEQCWILAGWGSSYDPVARQLVATRCGKGTYGSPEAVYGLGAAPCKVCTGSWPPVYG